MNGTVLSFGVEKRTSVMVNAWEVDVELFVSKSTGDSPYFIGVPEFEFEFEYPVDEMVETKSRYDMRR